jgi:APA family basic amino acid/polyamine antiporter
LIAAAVYTLGTISVFGSVPADELATSSSPFADAATNMWGEWFGDVVGAAAIVSALGTLNGFILLQGHMPRAAALEHLFPRHFVRLNRRGVPIFGLIASSLIATACVLIAESSEDGFEYLLLITTVTALVPYIFSAAAQLVLLRTDPGAFEGVRFAKDATIASLAFAYSVWTVYGGGPEATMWSFIGLLLGIPVYIWLRWEAVRSDEDVELVEATN